MSDQLASDTLSPIGGVNEQGFHVGAIQEHEARRFACLINGEPQRCSG